MRPADTSQCIMPPVCCRCNGSGRCLNCVCRKANRLCSNCLPSRRGQCENIPVTTLPNDSAVTTDVLPTQAIQETTLETAPSSPPDSPDSTPTEPTCSRVGQEHVSRNGGRWFDDLPHFCSSAEPNFIWGEVGGMVFRSVLNRIYDETVHWSRNLFKIPSGKAGTAFVREVSRMFRAFADSSALESVAMKVVMVMPALLLQKPHPRSKARDHVVHLERRLQLWLDGRLDELLKGRTIQRQLLRNPPKQQEDTASVCKINDGRKSSGRS